MKALLIMIFFILNTIVLAQDTSSFWLTNIDTASFRIFHKKHTIPKNFYPIIGIDKLKEIVSANKPYRKGCLGPLPGYRLNWLAIDDNNHWILSISFGGRAHGTKYLFIDKENEKLNVNGFRFIGSSSKELTLGEAIKKLNLKQYYRIDPYFLNPEKK